MFSFLRFSFTSILSPVVFSHIDLSSYIHSPLPIYFRTSFIYLPTYSLRFFTVCFLSYSYSTLPYSSCFLPIYPSLCLYLSERMNVCLLVCVGAHVCWRVCVRAFFLCLFCHCRRRHLNGLWMKVKDRKKESYTLAVLL